MVFAAEELNYRSETYISIFAQGDKLSTYSAYFTWHCASIPYVKNLWGDGGSFGLPSTISYTMSSKFEELSSRRNTLRATFVFTPQLIQDSPK